MVKSIINQALIKVSTDNFSNYKCQIEKHFVLIVKIYGNYEANMCFKVGWREAQIDILNGKSLTDISQEQLIDLNFMEIINNKAIFCYLLSDSITDTMSKIKYELQEEVIRVKIERIRNLVTSHPQIYNVLLELFIKLLK